MEIRNKDEMLSVAEVAREYKISEETVRRWMKSGHLPFVPVGPFKLRRIRRGDILRDAKSNGNGHSHPPDENLQPDDLDPVVKGAK